MTLTRVLSHKSTPPSCTAARSADCSSLSRTCTMSCDQRYPFPQVFFVDEGRGPRHSAQTPNRIPRLSFPPAAETMKSRGKSRGCMGISPSLAMVVLMLFLLVFAALGLEAWQILQLQKQIKEMPAEKVRTNKENVKKIKIRKVNEQMTKLRL